MAFYKFCIDSILTHRISNYAQLLIFCMKSKVKWHDVLSIVPVHVSLYQTVALVLPESAEIDDDDTGEFKELVYDSIQKVWLWSLVLY